MKKLFLFIVMVFSLSVMASVSTVSKVKVDDVKFVQVIDVGYTADITVMNYDVIDFDFAEEFGIDFNLLNPGIADYQEPIDRFDDVGIGKMISLYELYLDEPDLIDINSNIIIVEFNRSATDSTIRLCN